MKDYGVLTLIRRNGSRREQAIRYAPTWMYPPRPRVHRCHTLLSFVFGAIAAGLVMALLAAVR